MKNKAIVILVILLITSSFFFIWSSEAASLAEKVKGKILLQVEENGEAWYVYPNNLQRYYLGRPADAFDIMRDLGLGITNDNLNQIPVGLLEKFKSGIDTDSDGLVDNLEIALETNQLKADSDGDGYNDGEEVLKGYNPNGSGKILKNNSLINSVKGKILLQVEKNGEAWYLNPADSKRYYLGRPADAFDIMRGLGLGITNNNLAQVPKSSQTMTVLAEENVHQPTKNLNPFTDSEWHNLSIGGAIKASNNITVKVVDIYEIYNFSWYDKGVALNFYIDNQQINRYPFYYPIAKPDISDSDEEKISLFSGLRLNVSIKRSTATLAGIDMKVASINQDFFTSCQQVYELCLEGVAPTYYEQPRNCLKYCNDIKEVPEHYLAQDGKFSVIAPKKDFSLETVNNFLSYLKNIYDKVQDQLSYEPDRTDYLAVLLGSFEASGNSNAKNSGIFVRANDYPTLYLGESQKKFPTDITHELIHFFNFQNNFRTFLEEGYAVYQDYLIKVNNEYFYDYQLDCLDTTVRTKQLFSGAPYEYLSYDIKNYLVRACFWKELHESYPSVYNELIQEMQESRNKKFGKIYCLDDLEQQVSESFFAMLQEKYLEQYEDLYAIETSQGKYCRIIQQITN